MKKLLLALIFAATAAAQSPAPWQTLFDGKTLNGWRSLKSDRPGSGWTVEDGAIVRTGKSGDLVTVDEFGDFELELQWKVEKATNSGIIYRVGLSANTTWRTGPEYQILDNVDGADRSPLSHQAGALYDLVAPTKDMTKPVGEWNTTRVTVQGWHLVHWLNGERIVEIDLASPAGRALIAGSKFHTMPQFATLTRGHIALQDHDNKVWFRAIRIRALP